MCGVATRFLYLGSCTPRLVPGVSDGLCFATFVLFTASCGRQLHDTVVLLAPMWCQHRHQDTARSFGGLGSTPTPKSTPTPGTNHDHDHEEDASQLASAPAPAPTPSKLSSARLLESSVCLLCFFFVCLYRCKQFAWHGVECCAVNMCVHVCLPKKPPSSAPSALSFSLW